MTDSPDKITAQDVARLAGVSQSAVSRVFTPGASASQDDGAKVRAAAEQLGYRPDPLARAMITGRTRIIGLVVAYLDNQFYPMALERLSRVLQERGLSHPGLHGRELHRKGGRGGAGPDRLSRRRDHHRLGRRCRTT
jgi:hypothetical protein